MTPFEVKRALDAAVLLVDTREQDTAAFRSRMDKVGLPYERYKLNAGDYSIKTVDENDTEINCERLFAIERKMSLDELAGCYTRDRERFTREFERAKECNTRLYLLVENATWENLYNGKYRSKFGSNAFAASLLAWLTRYDCRLIFCKAETSARLIHDILYRELKEHLERGELG